MHRIFSLLPFLALPLLVLAVCHGGGSLTATELEEALGEAALTGQVEALTAGTQELTTTLTAGKAVEEAAKEIGEFVASQLPCAEVLRDGAKLTVTYGKLPGACTWRGQTYMGTHVVTVTRSAQDEVVVEHEWKGVKNQRLMVGGTAVVTWNLADRTRHVVHQLNWTRLADGRQGTGSGDRIQAPLAAGLAEGFEVNGTRKWQGKAGTWDLAIDGIEIRWADAVPQAGTYTLDTPYGGTATFTFARVDADTIAVTATDGTRTHTFHVSQAGVVTKQGD